MSSEPADSSPTRRHASGPRPGAQIGSFVVEGEIGAGGMGMVFAAVDQRDGSRVALKFLSSAAARDERDRARFLTEGRAISRLNHPNIIAVRELGEVDGRPFIAMDLIDGFTFDDWITETKPSSVRILAVIHRVARALQYAHEFGILHRDIKPGNIMIGADDQPVVMDFGLARDTKASDLGLTMRSEAIGTPPYMSPEQARGQRELVGPASDLWSLGVVLYEALTGTSPFDRGSVYETFQAIVNHEPPRLRQLRPDLSRNLDWVLCRCLEKDPSRRYRSAEEMAEDIDRVNRGETVRARPPGPLTRGFRVLRRHRVAALLASLCLGLASLGTYATYQDWRQRVGDWATVVEVDLSRPLPRGFAILDSHLSGPVDRPSTADGLALSLGQRGWAWLWFEHLDLAGDIRVEVELSTQFEDTLDFVVHGSRTRLGQAHFFPPGYVARIRSLMGSSLQRLDEPGFRPSVANSPLDLPIGRVAIVIERRDGRITLRINGQIALVNDDPLPIAFPNAHAVGLRCYRPDTILHRLKIERLGLPVRPTPLLAGDALLRHGQPEAALAAYRSVAADHRGSRLAEEALVRARLTLELMPLADPAIGKELEAQFRRDHPHSPHAAVVAEVIAITAWRRGDIDAALDAAELAMTQRPASSLPVRLVALRRARLDERQGQRYLRLLAQVEGIDSLDLGNLGLYNLDPLRGRRYSSLVLRQNRISNLDALTGMPLQRLILDNNPVGDLRPLAGMPLRELSLEQTAVVDLRPLAGMPLNRLSIARSPVSDLSPLIGIPLKHLNLSGSHVTSLPEALRDQIEDLALNGATISSLEPLVGRQLKRLTFMDARHPSLAPLRGLSLEHLNLNGSTVSDLSDLVDMPLHNLLLARTQVSDLAPLLRLPQIVELDLSETQVRDLGPVAALSLLRSLSVAGTSVTDLTPLRHLPLESLNISSTPVSSIAPIAHSRLRALRLNHTRIDDLHRLSNVQLNVFEAANADLRNLSMLAKHIPTTVNVSNNPLSATPELTGAALDTLSIADCPNVDLSLSLPLRVRSLNARGSGLSRMAPILKLGVESLTVSQTPADDIDAITEVPPGLSRPYIFSDGGSPESWFHLAERVKSQPDQQALVRMIQAWAHWRAGSLHELRTLAFNAPGHSVSRLILPILVPASEAGEIAARCGARLAIVDQLDVAWDPLFKGQVLAWVQRPNKEIDSVSGNRTFWGPFADGWACVMLEWPVDRPE